MRAIHLCFEYHAHHRLDSNLARKPSNLPAFSTPGFGRPKPAPPKTMPVKAAPSIEVIEGPADDDCIDLSFSSASPSPTRNRASKRLTISNGPTSPPSKRQKVASHSIKGGSKDNLFAGVLKARSGGPTSSATNHPDTLSSQTRHSSNPLETSKPTPQAGPSGLQNNGHIPTTTSSSSEALHSVSTYPIPELNLHLKLFSGPDIDGESSSTVHGSS